MKGSKDEAHKFLAKFEKSLKSLPSAPEMEWWVRQTTRANKAPHGDRHLRGPEAAFLNGHVIPALFNAIRAEGLSDSEARRALLNENHPSLPQYSVDSPARTVRHPFTKAVGASPVEIYKRWADPKDTKALVQSCPDFALRAPFAHSIVFEGKYFSQGSPELGRRELVRDIYQAFFYRGLPSVEETRRGRAAWEYEYAVLLAYDASPQGTLRAAWNALPAKVRNGFWEGANLYVMILGGTGREA